MSRLSEINDLATQALLGFRNLYAGAVASLAIGTVATGFKFAATPFLSNGVIKQKAATDAGGGVTSLLPTQARSVGGSLATTAQLASIAAGTLSPDLVQSYIQPAASTVYYTVGLEPDGTVYVAQGSYVGQTLSQDPTKGLGNTQAGSTWVGDGSIPDLPKGITVIGVVKIVTVGSTFTPGTTALTGISTFFDVSVLPVGKL